MTKLTPLLMAVLLSTAAAAAPIDKERLADHIHKSFSTPSTMKLTVGDFSPSPAPGWLAGTVEASDGKNSSSQPILVSEDGKWYFLGRLVNLVDTGIPGMRALAEDPGLPPVHLFPGGKYAVVAAPKDFSQDPDAVNRDKISLKDAAVSGPADAPVTLVEYSDLQCPHCKNSHDILAAELAKYPVKLRRVFKHYPLDSHPWAFDAALAVTCAAKSKAAAGDAVRDGFFSQQEHITVGDVRAKALEFAKGAGLPAEAFQRCLDDKGTKASVEADKREGDSLGVSGTPTLFINGRRVRGYAWPEVKAVLDELAPGKKT